MNTLFLTALIMLSPVERDYLEYTGLTANDFVTSKSFSSLETCYSNELDEVINSNNSNIRLENKYDNIPFPVNEFIKIYGISGGLDVIRSDIETSIKCKINTYK